MQEKLNSTHILIIGAGLVGLSAALALKNEGFSVRLLERYFPEPSPRPISLSYGSCLFLKKLGVWDALEKIASPILSVHVSEQGKFGVTHFSAREENVPALGFVVPFSELQKALYEKVTDIHPIDEIKNIVTDENGATIETKTHRFHANLLIAADGAHSTCRDFLKITYDEKIFDDIAEIYAIKLSESHQHIAYERFTKNGVMAVLPLFDQYRAQLVWTKRRDDDREDCNDSLSCFQSVFEGRLDIIRAEKIAEFPLKTVIANEQVTQSAILMGNAAHTIYPVAAQGFNLGLHDISVLIKILDDAKKHLYRINDMNILKKYEKAASIHQEKIFTLTDQLTTLFEFPGLGCARGLGLCATDVFSVIKKRLSKTAMGI